MLRVDPARPVAPRVNTHDGLIGRGKGGCIAPGRPCPHIFIVGTRIEFQVCLAVCACCPPLDPHKDGIGKTGCAGPPSPGNAGWSIHGSDDRLSEGRNAGKENRDTQQSSTTQRQGHRILRESGKGRKRTQRPAGKTGVGQDRESWWDIQGRGTDAGSQKQEDEPQGKRYPLFQYSSKSRRIQESLRAD